MEIVVNQTIYKCGHAHPILPYDERKEHFAELVETGKAFLCPQCCRTEFKLLELKCEAYANLQQMSPEMCAFVIEVTRVISPLSEILALNDYQQRAPSIDELTPGGDPLDLPHAVWRKEFWFANNTNPVHVVMLMEHVKQEIDWLASYMPSGKSAAHFGQFVGM
ncbi:hypothetical protein HZU75_01735 [Chitinibacter fontanus]|uniref:Uncharacterized protein n=1 Tax=Chitinibacter fontanus TaxID=1737446 RepID=A0A7D5V7R7_9NEIS|nr:hypothetical protein [Chitinibacter fontanus]QLI80356.1 hypothetical protein HZU75_01735 [Chitinibacter fontanus]